jgi:hypothetical protein
VTYKAPRAGVLRARGIAILNNRLTQVASASRRVRHRASVEMNLTISAAADRALRSQGSLKVRVTLTFKPSHGRPKSFNRTVTLHP